LLFQPLGEDGYEWHDANLYFNLYTGPGFLGMSLLIINIVLTVIASILVHDNVHMQYITASVRRALALLRELFISFATYYHNALTLFVTGFMETVPNRTLEVTR